MRVSSIETTWSRRHRDPHGVAQVPHHDDGQVAAPRGATVAAVQGAYYFATGVWPLVHRRSFEAVTGPKVDRWLVQTVGALVAVLGGALGLAARHRRVTPELALAAAGSAAALAAIDVVHVARRRIAPIYLADAVAEAGLIALWVAARSRNRQPREAGSAATATRRPPGAARDRAEYVGLA
jgi:hypothetical protein